MTATAIDLEWMGQPRCIAAWRVGELLIDCGPSTCLERLLGAVGDWRPRALLLTHIHFDHAGAAGALAEHWPGLEIYVHRRGARHLVSPERLEASARRVFGDEFDRRFGGLRPIPESRVRPLEGGEVIHGMQVMATPGHASHHVSFLDESGCAFVGDIAGVRLHEHGPVLLPTPPPDIDLDLWQASLEAVAGWKPERLALPHFGGVDDPATFFVAVRDELSVNRQLAEQGVAREEYVAFQRDRLGRRVGTEDLAALELVVPLAQNHAGLRRWIDQREAGTG